MISDNDRARPNAATKNMKISQLALDYDTKQHNKDDI